MSKKKIATIISRMGEPMVLLTGVAIVGGVHANLSSTGFFQYLTFLFLCMVAPILGLWIWFVKREGMSWDIPNRAKRIRPLLLVLGLVTLDGIFTIRLQSSTLNQLFLLFLVWLIGFIAITTQWKISGHTGIAALATGLVIAWYGWSFWPVLLIVPVIGWARVVRHDHTLMQVIVGAFYSFFLIVILSRFIG